MASSPASGNERVVPRLSLVLPPLLPLGLVGVLLVSQWSGHVMSAHGSGLVVGLLAWLSALVLLPYELYMLRRSLGVFTSTPAANTPLNWACFAFGTLFVAVVLGFVIFSLV